MILTPNQIAVLCYGANWHPKNMDKTYEKFLDQVIAIAHGESSFNTDAVNGQYVGLFQIGTVIHKEMIGSRDMRLPHYNVQVARDLSWQSFKAGHDKFAPWEAYTKKTPGYLAGLGHGHQALAYLKSKSNSELLSEYITLSKVDVGAAISPGLLPDGALDGLDWFGKFMASLPGIGRVVGIFGLGMILIILGAVFLIARSRAARASAGIVKKVLP